MSPALDGLYGAAHASDVAASLGNYREALLGGGVPAAKELARVLTSAWVAFARHGDPNNPVTPRWPVYAPPGRSTLIFDERLRVEHDPDADLRELWERLPACAGVFG
ncbi:MAG: carboxylesterase family protein [Gammaproteobacteria bacterium]|nr:carboxylesterase family protein [Gammaproteobacteria bacterium]